MQMQVSIFENATSPKTWFDRPLKVVLEQIRTGRFYEQVEKVRYAQTEEAKAEAKKSLPAFTASGMFKYRRAADLIKHSAFLCMDLDKVPNLKEVRRVIDNDPFTYASFISCSGKGLAFLVKINPEKHLESFLCIEEYYKHKNIPIQADKSCKDVSRLRFMSYDQGTYLFEESFTWDNFDFLKAKAEPKARKIYTYQNTSDTAKDVEYLVMAIESAGADITADYADWVKIAHCLNAEFGEAGIDFFHRISAMNGGYDPQQTDEKYKECNRPYKINSVAPIFSLAQKHGISLKKNRV